MQCSCSDDTEVVAVDDIEDAAAETECDVVEGVDSDREACVDCIDDREDVPDSVGCQC